MKMKKKLNKGFTLVEIMIVVVIIGLLAGMAIPAFKKVRQQTRETAIINNLRQIASGGQQYLLENGVTQVTYGAIAEYIKTFSPVAGESYTSLVVGQDGGTLSVTTASGETITFNY